MLSLGLGGAIYLWMATDAPNNAEEKNIIDSQFHGGRKHATSSQSLESQRKREREKPAEPSFDIQQALANLDSSPYGKEYQKLLMEIAIYYGNNDPEEGKLWLLNLDNSPENLRAFLFFGSSWTSSTQDIKSLDFYNEISHESFRDEFLKGCIPWLSMKTGESVINFLLTNSDKIRNLDSHLARTANNMASSDPQGCFSTISNATVSEQQRNEMYKGFFGRLTSQETWAKSVIPYLEKLTLEEDKDRLQAVLVDIVSAAPKGEFVEVAEMLNAVPPSAAKDEAAVTFSYSLADNAAPDSAALWVNAISNSELREKVVTRIFRKIQKFDRDLASQLLEDMNTSEEFKHTLRSGEAKD